jgi:hypothetical protein
MKRKIPAKIKKKKRAYAIRGSLLTKRQLLLSQKFKPEEISLLRKALFGNESFDQSKKIFRLIAKRHGVCSGDLEMALAARIGLGTQLKEKSGERKQKN